MQQGSVSAPGIFLGLFCSGDLIHTFCLGYVAIFICPHHGDLEKAEII